jgi:transcriptional regulator with XRE-family HTH domain
LPPLDRGKETIGQRVARIRKERGLSQAQFADRIGIIQALVSAYELGKLRLTAEMAIRFADVLGITTDELLRGKKKSAAPKRQPSLKLIRRLEQIESLPSYQQRALLTTIDNFIAAAQGR